MPTRPSQGGSPGTWGTELNAWLDAAVTPYNVIADYGAKGDGVNDDTTPIQNALNACSSAGGGIVYFPPGTYKITATLNVSDKVELCGAGHGANLNAAYNIAWNPVSQIKWVNVTGNKMISVAGPARVNIRNLGLDGNNQATYGIWTDRLQASVIENIGIQNVLTDLIWLGTTSLTVNANTQNNYFRDIWMYTGNSNTGAMIRLTGTANANACHNTFSSISGGYAGDGIVLDKCDNNKFDGVICNQLTGSGVGVRIKADARSNYFYHLESIGGVFVETPTFSSNVNGIVFYDRNNNEAVPTFQSAAASQSLFWLESGLSGSNPLAIMHGVALRDDVRYVAQGIRGQPFPLGLCTQNLTMVGGTVYMVSVGLLAGDVVTNILVPVNSAGTGLTLSKVGIYNSSGTRVAISADQGTSWQSGGAKVVPLTATYTATQSDLYYLAVVATGTTPPGLLSGINNSALGALSYSPGTKSGWGSGGTGQTDLPATASFSATVGNVWLGWN